jgi:hypothetical protein
MLQRLAPIALLVLLQAPVHVGADAQIVEWIGEYAMNHDGHQGALHIDDSKRDCGAPAWCHLVISYVDTNGARFSATIRTIDQAFQHMVFEIAFPGNGQRFDAYLMSWDKSQMAGTTVWQGRTFGFYAFRRAVVRSQLAGAIGIGRGGQGPVSQNANRKTINADGEVQTLLPDGGKRLTRPGGCGFTIVSPDGTKGTVTCNQVQPATPPILDQVSGKWLDAHNSSLFDIIRTLLGNDQSSLDNYLRTAESSSPTVYEKIRLRTSLISMLAGAS